MDRIAWFLMINAAGAALLMLVALLACRLVRRPEFTHQAWLVVLLKFVVPPMVVLPVVPVFTTAIQNDAVRMGNVQKLPESPVSLDQQDGEEWDEVVDESALLMPIKTDPGPDAAPMAANKPTWSWSWMQFAAAVWATGALGYWLAVVIGTIRFGRRLQLLVPIDAETLRVAQDAALRVGLSTVPAMSFVGPRISPLVWAPWSRPRVFLPADLWRRLTSERQRTILAHEFAHVARRDHWIRRLEVLILGCYWWFPLAWYVRNRLRQAEESCCDARVLRAFPELADSYAEALIEVASFVARPGRIAFASGGSAPLSELKRRIAMIVSSSPRPAPSRLTAMAFLAGAVALLSLRIGYAQDTTPELPTTPATPAPVVAPQPPVQPAAPAATMYPALAAIYQVPGTPTPAPPTVWPSRGQQQIKDEIELLEAQRQTKLAHVNAARSVAEKAHETLAVYERSGKSVSKLEIIKVEAEASSAKGQVGIQEAELNEITVKIKQAKRRLSEADPTKARTVTGTLNRVAPTTPGPTVSQPLMPGRPALVDEAKPKEAADADAKSKADDRRVRLNTTRAYLGLRSEEQKLEAELAAVQAQLAEIKVKLEAMKKQRNDQQTTKPDDASRP